MPRSTRSSTRSRIVRTVACLLCAIPLVAWAQRGPGGRGFRPAATQPADRFGRDGRGFSNLPQPNWEDVQEWMEVHCPRRLAAMASIRYTQRRENLKQVVSERYARLQMMKRIDAPLAKLMEKQAELDDKVFGCELDLQTNSSDQEKAKEALKAAVAELVKKNLEIREYRVEKLRKNLERMQAAFHHQKSQLDADQKNEDKLVENRFQFELGKVQKLHGHPAPSGHGEAAVTTPDTSPSEENDSGQ